MNAVASKPEPAAPKRKSVADELLADGSQFDFFQAVSLLERIDGTHARGGCSREMPARFTTVASTAFPASAIQEITQHDSQPPEVAVNFMGLTGPSGVLPRHYTELVMQLERDTSGPARRTMRAWFDLFNNRFVSLMYSAWQRMRTDRGVARGQAEQVQCDPFTAAGYSLVGLGTSQLRNRLRVTTPAEDNTDNRTSDEPAEPQMVDQVRDLALLRHAGTMARRRRSARQIASLLTDYFQVPVEVEQFRGQWLELDPASQTRLGAEGGNSQLSLSAVVGSRVWDVKSRVRIRLGPLTADQFRAFLPDCEPGSRRRRFLMLSQVVRLLLGPELSFELQLVLAKDELTPLPVNSQPQPTSPRLGWDTWLATGPAEHDLDDALFEPMEALTLG